MKADKNDVWNRWNRQQETTRGQTIGAYADGWSDAPSWTGCILPVFEQLGGTGAC